MEYRYVDKSVTIRGKQIKLTPVRKKQKEQRDLDPDGIKIRIFDAYRMQTRAIHGDEFDEWFERLGVNIIIRARPERCRENRNFFNTNRFIVVKKTNEKGESVDFGDKITVSGYTFKLSYPGKLTWCPECETKHGWDCPTKARDAHLRQMRQGLTAKTKIYSDSTLRHTNQLALRTDVACMSGGGIAQLCNVIPFDDHQQEEVIINAGTNEIKTESIQEFAYTLQKAEQKLRELATTTPVTLVIPQLVCNTPELVVKNQVLTETMQNIDTIKTIFLHDIEYDESDAYHHPTVKGTQNVLQQINAAYGEDIILTDCQDDLVTKRIYRKVQSLFKVGCRGCDDLHFHHSLCDNCKEEALKIDTTILQQQINKVKEEMYPVIVSRGNKRPLSENEEDENVSKAPKGGN